MRHLRIAIALMMIGTGTALAQSPAPTPAPKHVLQGAWVIQQLGGNPAPAGVSLVLTVAADGTYIATVDDKVEERGTVRVDASKKPMTLDFIISEGSSAGKTQLGVFELGKDGGLKMSLATPGVTTRPVDFAVSAANEVIVLKKKV